jgi:hypothetical protein
MAKLSDMQIKSWISKGERFEGKGDGDGLVLSYRKDFAIPLWRFRYRFASKQRVMNIGTYGQVSLADARKLVKDLKARVALGHDVAAEKQDRKALLLTGRTLAARKPHEASNSQFDWKYPFIFNWLLFLTKKKQNHNTLN